MSNRDLLIEIFPCVGWKDLFDPFGIEWKLVRCRNHIPQDFRSIRHKKNIQKFLNKHRMK